MSEAQLRDRIEYLEAENANLRSQLVANHSGATITKARQVFCIRPAVVKVLLALIDGRAHSKDSLFNVLYMNKLDQPELKIVDVYVHYLRAGLEPHGISVKTVWAFGYQMAPEDCAKVKALLGIEARP